MDLPEEEAPAQSEGPRLETALRAEVERLLKVVQEHESAREVASRYIGTRAIPWIVLLVAMGLASAYALPQSVLSAAVGMVSTATMALIAMLAGITGTKDVADTPETAIIKRLIEQIEKLTRPERMIVEVREGQVIVRRGEETFETVR